MTADIHMVEVKCPKDLVDQYDEAWKAAGFKTRSEALRHQMRSLIAQYTRTKGGLP